MEERFDKIEEVVRKHIPKKENRTYAQNPNSVQIALFESIMLSLDDEQFERLLVEFDKLLQAIPFRDKFRDQIAQGAIVNGKIDLTGK